jgi:hypothetical protein
MKTYKLIKDNLTNFRGHAALYEVNPPMDASVYNRETGKMETKKSKYVVASGITADDHGGAETFLFLSNSKGEVEHWTELAGSDRGVKLHSAIFESIGYNAI